ncbi:MAG: hypothetical protein WC949_04500 [Candidatus Paceibacterota bacterium]
MAKEGDFSAEELMPKYKGIVNSVEDIVSLGKLAIEEGIRQMEKNIGERREEMAVVLQSLLEEAEVKPLLPKMRPRDWFKVGDSIMSARAVCPLRFEKAKVVSEPDDVGVIKIRFDSDDKASSTFVINYMVMKVWEFNYLKTHPDFMKDWYLGKGTVGICGKGSFADAIEDVASDTR